VSAGGRTLLVAVVTPIGLSVLVAVTLANGPGHGQPVDPLLPGLLSLEYAALAVGVSAAVPVPERGPGLGLA
jgi:hypothetical protein